MLLAQKMKAKVENTISRSGFYKESFCGTVDFRSRVQGQDQQEKQVANTGPSTCVMTMPVV